MKKIALFLVLILVLTFAACAQQAPAPQPTPEPQPTEQPAQTTADEPIESAMISGVIVELTEEGLLIENAENGQILVITGEETVFETTGDIQPGDYIYVDYNGQMTFSLPAQIGATVVRMHKLEGEITEIYAEENAVLLNNAEMGDVYVYLPEEYKNAAIDFAHMTVYFDGAMTMSLPGKISAGLVIPGYSVQGAITEIAEGYILIGEGMEAVQVNFAAGQLPETAAVGAVVRVIYDGQMTRSIPAQITATEIVQLSR
ncbi:MAG: hypothetical protein IJB41_00770 [Clostridia bacterium]|nr:hypothetical protein [Clostridia bacterium]